ncbi:MFS transporter [Glycomyces artemisiae]|uniref:Putative MFS family arabinose efflux permease n=1 Tax=Glycomyces artemisiae TaxID=1076443 RepID=A0A2T0UNX3_9ACTN|nr:MFS transporter [Glycomyces artemisiae]PRY59604.1 putative MFS family arabinose efflux permease [Glycomyces artemisiae]
MTTMSPTAAEAPLAPAREPRSYPFALAGANFGLYVALLTPVMVSMAFKVQHLTATPGEAASSLGLVLGVGAFFALVANPLVGRLSDRTTSRFGMRRPWILGGVATGFLALALIGAAQSVWLVLLGWCVAQAALNAVMAAANATLPDQVPAERRGKTSGIVGITTPLGILGGSFLVNFIDGDFARFTVPAALAAVLCTLFALTLKDRVLTEKPAQRLTFGQFLGSFVFNPVKHPDFGWTWLTKFLVMFGYAGIAAYLPYYLTESFHLSESEAVSTILLANIASMVMMALSSPIGGIISDRLGRRRAPVAFAGIVMALGLAILAFAPNTGVVILAQGVIGLGAGAFFSVDLALATQVLPNPDDTAKDLGVLNIANALPQSIAPAIAPAILAVGGATPLGGYPFWYLFGAVVALAGAVLVYRIKAVK